MLDVGINFFSAYENNAGLLIYQRKTIIYNYVTGWFLIDFSSSFSILFFDVFLFFFFLSIPLYLFINYNNEETDDTDTSSDTRVNKLNNLVRLSRVSRLYKLAKLVRIVKMIRLFRISPALEKIFVELRF